MERLENKFKQIEIYNDFFCGENNKNVRKNKNYGKNVFAEFLYGSQNYGLDTSESDVDTSSKLFQLFCNTVLYLLMCVLLMGIICAISIQGSQMVPEIDWTIFWYRSMILYLVIAASVILRKEGDE